MSRITIQDVQNYLGVSQSYDIINAIINSNPSTFSQFANLASAQDVANFGAALQMSQTVQNAFVTALVDRIGLVVVKQASLENPLKKFKKGQLPQGRSIEEIFTDITTEQKYNPSDAETTLFKRTIPNVKTLFHDMNRQGVYTQSISDEQLSLAFVNAQAFDNFLSSIINAIYNSAEVDEYEYMKLVVDNYYAKGFFKVVPVSAPVDATSATAFVKAVRSTVRKMTLPNGSRDFNSLAVRQRSAMEDMHLLIDADTEAEIDVDVLAKAFNMSRTDFLGNVTVIDGFASTGLKAVLVDKEFFMVYDKLQKLETVRNPKGLYWNYFYHVWQIMSASRFANAVAFVTGSVPAVTQVIVSPAIIQLAAGSTYEFTAYVHQTDTLTHPITWSVAGSTATTSVASGTAIDANGNLTIGSAQTGELLVTATSTGTGTDISAAAWAATHAYNLGDEVTANGNVYRAVVAGTSASTAPTGTGTNIADGATLKWNYIEPAAPNVVGQSIVTIGV
jgi:hypothetical protein